MVRAGTTAQRLVLRARIVLLAGEGLPTEVIARKLRIDPNTARKWRRRWRATPDVAALGL
jgi:transposase-like protein